MISDLNATVRRQTATIQALSLRYSEGALQIIDSLSVAKPKTAEFAVVAPRPNPTEKV